MFNFCFAGDILKKPDLKEDSEEDEDIYNDYNPGEPHPSDFLNKQNNLNSIHHVGKSFKCHSCDAPDCSQETICHNAVQCWKSRVRQSNG